MQRLEKFWSKIGTSKFFLENAFFESDFLESHVLNEMYYVYFKYLLETRDFHFPTKSVKCFGQNFRITFLAEISFPGIFVQQFSALKSSTSTLPNLVWKIYREPGILISKRQPENSLIQTPNSKKNSTE